MEWNGWNENIMFSDTCVTQISMWLGYRDIQCDKKCQIMFCVRLFQTVIKKQITIPPGRWVYITCNSLFFISASIVGLWMMLLTTLPWFGLIVFLSQYTTVFCNICHELEDNMCRKCLCQMDTARTFVHCHTDHLDFGLITDFLACQGNRQIYL